MSAGNSERLPALPAPPILPDAVEREQQKEVLQHVGEYLYRRWGWQTDLARRLRVDSRTVRRWVSGQEAISELAWEMIKLLVRWKSETGEVP